ncbi:hypothetical protein Bmyc01_14880 [Bacillus mycoides]|nr:hypothetical protein Bmyc01_14880 [Bacillus mycoides]
MNNDLSISFFSCLCSYGSFFIPLIIICKTNIETVKNSSGAMTIHGATKNSFLYRTIKPAHSFLSEYGFPVS